MPALTFMNSEAPIYVDKLFVMESREPAAFKVGQHNGHQWCHMWSEDVERLHWMAERIGMQRSWFQNKGPSRITGLSFPHYDLVPSKRRMAIAYGAVEKELSEWLRAKTRATKNSNECITESPTQTPGKQCGFDFLDSTATARKHFEGG